MQRRVRWSWVALVSMAAFALGLLPAQVDAQAAAPVATPPVAVDDHVVITPLSDLVDVHVLANDTDADGGDLQVCRIDAPDDEGVGAHIWSRNGEPGFARIRPASTYVMIEPRQPLAPGSYPVTYYACDRQLLTPATLTVEVRKITARAIADQPGSVRFTNPLDEPIEVEYGPPHGSGHAAFRLAAHATKDRQPAWASIVWVAYLVSDLDSDGDDPLPVGYGRVRHTGASGRVALTRRLGGPAADLRRAAEHRYQAVLGDRSPHLSRTTRPNVHTGVESAMDPPAPNAAPVTAPDHVTLDYYDDAHVRVLRNDSDDTPEDLGVCWIDVPTGVGLDALLEPWWAGSDRARSDDPDRYIDLGADGAEPGTYVLTYYACDRQFLTPGTLRVTVRKFPPPVARRVLGHPGVVSFRNHGYRTVSIQYFRTGHYSEKHHLRVAPHTVRRLHVRYDSLTYFADTRIGPLELWRDPPRATTPPLVTATWSCPERVRRSNSDPAPKPGPITRPVPAK